MSSKKNELRKYWAPKILNSKKIELQKKFSSKILSSKKMEVQKIIAPKTSKRLAVFVEEIKMVETHGVSTNNKIFLAYTHKIEAFKLNAKKKYFFSGIKRPYKKERGWGNLETDYPESCNNTSFLVSNLNLNNLNFSNFFTYEECVFGRETHFSGGRMVPFKDGKILLSIGEYESTRSAQDENSMFGKIISIDLKTKEFETVSMGHRNPQGLFYDQNLNIIVNTEHGPVGGDEININLNPDNETIENYGWPISSYGMPLSQYNERDEPLNKSHKDFGFIEPIKYFVPSIGISEIIKIPKTFNEKFKNDFFVSAMGFRSEMDEGDRSIHHLRFNESFDKIIFEDVIPIGERIRDMIFIEEKNVLLLVLESIPAIGVLKLAN